MKEDLSIQLHQVLKEKFKLDDFRPGQLEAIITLINHGRLLCVQPTGHGKSLLYQLPAVIFDGITLVVSPLLALMRDQIHQLNNRFDIPALSINSDQSETENNRAQLMAVRGKIKILFVSPEKLDHIEYFNFLLNLPISLLVIDEAHCISTWGHDFRPSYRQIINFIHVAEQKHPDLKILAITATANHKTEEDVKNQLASNNQKIIIQRQDMDRPNIQLSVLSVSGLAEKLCFLVELLTQLSGNGLIYCATRENTELVTEYLLSNNISAAAYHAGIESDHKRELQHNFINNQYKVIAATNALGMGIDKQDLRFIIHFDIPGSITAYYQEVGRCGRDGKPAQGILLFDENDKKIQTYFIASAQPNLQNFECIIDVIKNAQQAPGILDIKNFSGLHPTLVNVILAELINQDFVYKKSQNRKQCYHLNHRSHKPDLSLYVNQFQTRTYELEQMISYSKQSESCLMQLLRNALGDQDADTCKHCSICSPGDAQKISTTEIQIAENWLAKRTTVISGGVKKHLSDGVSVLNSQLQRNLFTIFMKSRASDIEISDHKLLSLIKQQLENLKRQYSFGAIIPIPSRTWSSRDFLTQYIADYLNVIALTDYLEWRNIPNSRQGELLNNDQRRRNVAQNMHRNKKNTHKIPAGSILLLDDYTGSGATLHEAGRVLSKESYLKNPIIPFTVTTVKWRMGKRGMI